MLCGRRLFDRGADGPSLLAVLDAEVTRPSDLRPEIDPRWDVVLVRGLARRPDDRYPTAGAMAAALATLAEGQTARASADLVALIARALAVPAEELAPSGSAPAGDDLLPTRPLRRPGTGPAAS